MTYRNDLTASRLLVTTALAALLLGATPSWAGTETTGPAWTPKSSERLVKLPASYLKKSLEHDFQDSSLGQALRKTEENIGLKGGTLTDLQTAVEEADGELKVELRHQFLAEKRAYLELMQGRIDMHRKQATTKLRLFENMLKRLAQDKAADTPARRELIDRQEAARARLDQTMGAVDLKVFATAGAPESRYAVKYAENVSAIETLRARIKSHQMNRAAGADGEELTKEEYIRLMLSDAQSEVAVLEQEEKVLGYMAKLVALDALQLSEEAMDADLADSSLPGDAGPAKAVNFFMSN